jgi:hypothetical protein
MYGAGVSNSITSHESRAQGDVENTLHDPADLALAEKPENLPAL